MIDAWLGELRSAVRGLARRPTHAAASIVTLALVVGAATQVVAVISATMIRPLPFPHGDRLVQLFLMPPGASAFSDRNPYNNRAFVRFRAGLRQVEAFEGFWVRERVLGGGEEPESVPMAAVSPGALALFGGSPMTGRMFTEQEANTDAKVAVLGYGLWQRRFGGQQRIVGSTVLIDRELFEVIGIMPPDFVPGYVAAEIWTPLYISEPSLNLISTVIQTFARVRPEVSLDQLRAELDAAMQRVIEESPRTHTGWTTRAMSLRDAQFGQQRPVLWMLLAAVLTLASIAAANLANLTLAQVVARRPDLALRTALGGRTVDIVRLLVIETLILATVGTATGLLLGRWMLPALLALDPTTAQRLGAVRIDWYVLAVIAGMGMLIALLSGLLPLVKALQGDLAAGVAKTGWRAIGSRGDQGVRQFMVGLQTAMAVILVSCGALLISGLNRASHLNPGFDPSNVLGAQLRVSAAAYPNEAARAAFISDVVDRLRALPGVLAASATLNLFVPELFFQTTVQIEGRPTPDGQPHTVQFRRIGTEYFKTMGIPLIRGRDLERGDGLDTQQVAVISQSFADRFWPSEDAIGKRVLRGTNNRPAVIVGIVGDLRDVSLTKPPSPMIYTAYAQSNAAGAPVSLVVRTAGNPVAHTAAVRAAVLSVDPAQPIDHVLTLEQFLSDSLGPQRFRSALLVVLAVIGLAIAAVGVFGVTARAVEERTREIGVRMALGATRVSLIRAVAGQTLRAVIAGLAVGTLTAVLAAMTLLRTLPGLSTTDAWTAAPALALLPLTAALAAAIPAWHAASLDPVIALRVD